MNKDACFALSPCEAATFQDRKPIQEDLWAVSREDLYAKEFLLKLLIDHWWIKMLALPCRRVKRQLSRTGNQSRKSLQEPQVAPFSAPNHE